jgi:hypothetical protein
MATYYVEAGHGGTDSGTEANPWLTIDQAMAGLGDGDKVWVKATASYTETVDIDGHQATWNTPIVIEGYTSSTGDGGKVTIDGGAARASGIVESGFAGNTNYVFKNFIIQNHTSHGIDLNDVDRFTWKNCEFIGNGTVSGHGALVGLLHAFENCKFNSNSADGCACQSNGIFIGCEFMSNGGSGLDGSGTTLAVFCTFFSNGTTAMDSGASHDVVTLMVNCTVDGDGKDTVNGLNQSVAFRHFGAIVNCILYDCTNGIDFSNGEAFISRNNLVNSNTNNYINGAGTYSGEVTSAPAFVDEGSQDYALTVASPARDAGYDGSILAGGTQRMDIGSMESTGPGGPGGANKRGGKQL